MRVLMLHDTERESEGGLLQWAYARRTAALVKHAPPGVHVERMNEGDWRVMHAKQWDLIFLLDYMQTGSFMDLIRRATIGHHKPVVVASFNKDANSRLDYWKSTCELADWVIVNNRHRFDTPPFFDNTSCISNGVDTDDWFLTRPIERRRHRVLWCGSTGPAKGKGWDEVLQPLREHPELQDFEFDFRPINDITPELVYPTGKQRDWYNSGSYYLNASRTEGTPSAALEAMACGCVYVSTEIGNVCEFGESGVNCVITPRNVHGFAAALRYARDNRERLSAAGASTMENYWSYGEPGNRARYFWALFKALVERGPERVARFAYDQIRPEDI